MRPDRAAVVSGRGDDDSQISGLCRSSWLGPAVDGEKLYVRVHARALERRRDGHPESTEPILTVLPRGFRHEAASSAKRASATPIRRSGRRNTAASSPSSMGSAPATRPRRAHALSQRDRLRRARQDAARRAGGPLGCTRQRGRRRRGARSSGRSSAFRKKRTAIMGRPQRSARPQVQGLYLGPETSGHCRPSNASCAAAPRSNRSSDAPSPSTACMGRNYPAGAYGDAANAVLAGAGYNFRRLLRQAPAVRGKTVCRLHRAAGGAPKGNRNARKHGGFGPRHSPQNGDRRPWPAGSRDDGCDRIEPLCHNLRSTGQGLQFDTLAAGLTGPALVGVSSESSRLNRPSGAKMTEATAVLRLWALGASERATVICRLEGGCARRRDEPEPQGRTKIPLLCLTGDPTGSPARYGVPQSHRGDGDRTTGHRPG